MTKVFEKCDAPTDEYSGNDSGYFSNKYFSSGFSAFPERLIYLVL